MREPPETILDRLGTVTKLKPKTENSQERLSIALSDFVNLDIPPRRRLLAPWLQSASLNMVHAWRGTGKSHFALGTALAAASGGRFLRWPAEKPCRTVYIDGEMPAKDMQQWAVTALAASNLEMPAGDLFRLVTPDLMPDSRPMPNLYTPEGQAALDPDLDGCALVVFDNLATLFRSGEDQNAAGNWLAAQDYLLSLRRRGIAVLLVDHDNKSGGNRGTSAKEDVLETVIHLKQPSDYVSSQGARFEVHFSKHRGFCGKDAASFEAQLIEDRGHAIWTMRDAEDAELSKYAELVNAGLKDRDIRAELGIGGSKLARLKQAFQSGSPK